MAGPGEVQALMLESIAPRLVGRGIGSYGSVRPLLSADEFLNEVGCERLRSYRRAIPFCVVGLEVAPGLNSRRHFRNLVRLVYRNLRITDRKARISSRRLSILLVDTPEMGGRTVVDRLERLASRRGLPVTMTLSVHDPEGFGDSSTRHGSDRAENSDDDPGQNPSESFDSREHSLAGTFSGSERERYLDETFRVDQWGESLATPHSQRDVHTFGSHSQSSQPQELLKTSHSRTGLTVVDLQTSVDCADCSSPDEDVTTRSRDLSIDSRQRSKPSDEVTFSKPPMMRMAFKRTLDVIGASLGLALTSPLLLAAIVAIRKHDGAAAIYTQTREGRDGKPFTIYKLRTMIPGAEKEQAALKKQSHRDGPAFKVSNDPRVTPIGSLLRKTCIDELPQLWNVIKGEMSLVGPRPLPWHESRACERWHRRRLDVRPGLTCYWQVDKDQVESFDDWMRLDLRYLNRFNAFEDLRLIARTLAVPVSGRGSE